MPYLTTRKNLKLQLSPGLVASYDIQPGNGVGLFWYTTHTPDPHGGRILIARPRLHYMQCGKNYSNVAFQTVCDGDTIIEVVLFSL